MSEKRHFVIATASWFVLNSTQFNVLRYWFYVESSLKWMLVFYCLCGLLTVYVAGWRRVVTPQICWATKPCSSIFEDLKSGPDPLWVYQGTLLEWDFFFQSTFNIPFFFNPIFHFSRQTSHPLWFSYLFVVLRLVSLVCPFNLLSFSSLKHLLFAPSLFMIFNWRLSRDVWPAKTVCVDSITEEGQLQSVALLIENPCTGEKTGLRSTSFLIIPKSHLIFSGKHALRIDCLCYAKMVNSGLV